MDLFNKAVWDVMVPKSVEKIPKAMKATSNAKVRSKVVSGSMLVLPKPSWQNIQYKPGCFGKNELMRFVASRWVKMDGLANTLD